LFFLHACGVKSPPLPPQNSQLPSYIDYFLESPQGEEEEEEEEEEESERELEDQDS
jgi:hypothetical protein